MSHAENDRLPNHESSFGEAEQQNARTLMKLAVEEDLGSTGDLTATVTIPAAAQGRADFVARADGVLCGLPIAKWLAEQFQLTLKRSAGVWDGARLTRGQIIATVSGPMRNLLSYERTALNFMQHLSGVSTLTHQFVVAVQGTRAQILDTRKTTPGWRFLEKYAVRCGGGRNHRIGLFDAVLIKDNHLAWLMHPEGSLKLDQQAAQASALDPVVAAVRSARAGVPAGTIVEIEVDSLAQFERALECGPDIILLDNFKLADMGLAVQERNNRKSGILLEASGGVNLTTVRKIAETGVDRISVGALTHSSPALDIALDYDSD